MEERGLQPASTSASEFISGWNLTVEGGSGVNAALPLRRA
jgi:hypothetical protein